MTDQQPDDIDDVQENQPAKTTIQPARPWPVFSVDHARAELIAMQLLATGYSVFRVSHQTRLTKREVRRLAEIVAEEARNPRPPRIVGRTPPRPNCRRHPAAAAPSGPAPAPIPPPAPEPRVEEQLSLLD